MAIWNLIETLDYGPVNYSTQYAVCDGVSLYALYDIVRNSDPADLHIQSWNETDGLQIHYASFAQFDSITHYAMAAYKGSIYIMLAGFDNYPNDQIVRVYKYTNGLMNIVFELDTSNPITPGYAPYNYLEFFEATNNHLCFKLLTYHSASYMPNEYEIWHDYYSYEGNVWTETFAPSPLDAFPGTTNFITYAGTQAVYFSTGSYRIFQVNPGSNFGLFKWAAAGWDLVYEYPSYGSYDDYNIGFWVNNRDYIWGAKGAAYNFPGASYLHSSDGITWITPITSTDRPLRAINHVISVGIKSGGDLTYFISGWQIGESVEHSISSVVESSFLIGSTIYVLCSNRSIYKRSSIFPETAEVWAPPTLTYTYRGYNIAIEAGASIVYVAAKNLDTNYPEVLAVPFEFNDESELDISYQPGAGSKISVIAGKTVDDAVWAGGEFGGVSLVRKIGENWETSQPTSEYWVGPSQGMTMLRGDHRNLLVNDAASDHMWVSYFTENDPWYAAWNDLGPAPFDVNVTDVSDITEEIFIGIDATDPYWLAGYWYYHMAYSQDYGVSYYDVSYGNPLSQNSVTGIISGMYKYGED